MPLEPTQENSDVRSGSERGFGIVFAVVFAIVAAWPMLDGSEPRLWAAGVAVILLAASLLYPRALTPFNRVWFRFGLLLNGIVTPVVLALIYGLTVVPIGLVMRALGKDPLRLRRGGTAESYWLARDQSRAGTMTNQF